MMPLPQFPQTEMGINSGLDVEGPPSASLGMCEHGNVSSCQFLGPLNPQNQEWAPAPSARALELCPSPVPAQRAAR